MGLGPLAFVSLAEAREKARAARLQRYNGEDPLGVRIGRRPKVVSTPKGVTFREAMAAYIDTNKAAWRNEKHIQQWSSTLETYAVPHFGGKLLADVETADVLNALKPIWLTKSETARLSRPRALPLWLRLARRFSPARLLAAALRYLREDPDVKRYCSPQGLANWLRDEKFEAWMPATDEAAPPTPSSVPTALAQAVMKRKGSAWTASWLDPCRYDAPLRVLYARTAFAAMTIAAELGGLLREFGIGIATVAAS